MRTNLLCTIIASNIFSVQNQVNVHQSHSCDDEETAYLSESRIPSNSSPRMTNDIEYELYW
jgi:hypothetical protein